MAQAIDRRADAQRSFDNVRDAERASDSFVLNPVQGAADAASALRAVGIASENAGLDMGLKIGGIVGRHFGEEARLRIDRRVDERAHHAFGDQKLSIAFR